MIDQPIKTVPGDCDRKWFTDDDFDLIVWYDNGGAIHGFQFCYDKPRSEKAFTWLADRGFSHMKVDDGELNAFGNQTPILLPSGQFSLARVKAKFQLHSQSFPTELRELVLQKIDQYKRRNH